MSEDDIRDGSIELGTEIAKHAVPEIAEALSEFLPGVKLLAGLWSLSQQHSAEKFIQGIAHELKWDDGEMAAIRLAEEAADPIKRARVILGFRQILETWDELACECITILVADSLRGTQSNRDYQLAARLLSECSHEMLRGLDAITRLYIDMVEGRAYPWPSPHGEEATGRALVVQPDTDATWVAAFLPNVPSTAAYQSAVEVIRGARNLADVLARADFGRLGDPRGVEMGDVTTHGRGGVVRLVLSVEHDDRMRALFRYLAPVRVRSKTG